MFATQTQKLIEDAIANELQNARVTYGNNYNSLHEGYAVLKEEIEEAQEELNRALETLGELWTDTKAQSEKDVKSDASSIAFDAYYLALEACQIAAVCKKIIGD